MGWRVALLSEPSRGWPGLPSTPPTSLLCPIRHQSPPVSPCLLPGEASDPVSLCPPHSQRQAGTWNIAAEAGLGLPRTWGRGSVGGPGVPGLLHREAKGLGRGLSHGG